MRFPTGADLAKRRIEYKAWYARQHTIALRAGHDLAQLVARHADRNGLNIHPERMTGRELRHWRRFITRQLKKKRIAG